MQKECIVAFPLQQWLHESDPMPNPFICSQNAGSRIWIYVL